MQQIQDRTYATITSSDIFISGWGSRDQNTSNLNVNINRIEGIFYGLNSLAGLLANIPIRMRLLNPTYSVTAFLP